MTNPLKELTKNTYISDNERDLDEDNEEFEKSYYNNDDDERYEHSESDEELIKKTKKEWQLSLIKKIILWIIIIIVWLGVCYRFSWQDEKQEEEIKEKVSYDDVLTLSDWTSILTDKFYYNSKKQTLRTWRTEYSTELLEEEIKIKDLARSKLNIISSKYKDKEYVVSINLAWNEDLFPEKKEYTFLEEVRNIWIESLKMNKWWKKDVVITPFTKVYLKGTEIKVIPSDIYKQNLTWTVWPNIVKFIGDVDLWYITVYELHINDKEIDYEWYMESIKLLEEEFKDFLIEIEEEFKKKNLEKVKELLNQKNIIFEESSLDKWIFVKTRIEEQKKIEENNLYKSYITY